MQRAILSMIALGVVIGCLLPNGRTAPPASAASVSGAEARPIETVLERRANGHFLATADVNGEPVRFVVDTGANIVALTEDDARRAHVAFDPGQYEVVGHGASGEVRGQEVMLDSVVLDGKRVANLRGLVLEGSRLSLLGQNYLRHVSVEMKDDTIRLR